MTTSMDRTINSDRLPEELIRISDPDAPIYRIFPLWFLEETLRLRQLTLVRPNRWEDPFEIVGDAIAVDQWREGCCTQTIINQDLPPAFAQCWSATAESDALLRVYSRVEKDSQFRRNMCPRNEGVQVRSTARKLLHALLAKSNSEPRGRCYVGSVRYLSHEQILQDITNAIGTHGLSVFQNPANRARLLLLKRKAFAHEAEVRLIYVCEDPRVTQVLLRVPIDPAEVFDEITFDPRLESFERLERKALIRGLGYQGLIGQSFLYTRTLLQVFLGKRSMGRGESSRS